LINHLVDMVGRFELTDVEYERVAALLPSRKPVRGGRWRDHRQVINGILFRVRAGVPWRDVPERYGPYQTLYKRFARWQEDGTWERIQKRLQAQADAVGELDWAGHIDSTVVRAHQHAAGAAKGGAARMNHVPGKGSGVPAAGSPRRSTRFVKGEDVTWPAGSRPARRMTPSS
jgi:transposase